MKNLFKPIQKVLSLLLCVMLVLSALMLPALAEDKTSTVAHWKFQDVAGYYSGDLNGDNFMFRDLTGHGNDLLVAKTGSYATAKEPFFKWNNGSTLAASSKSALFFNNSYDLAKGAKAPTDPYTGDGSFLPTAKFFNTIAKAPMNNMTFNNGYTIEAIFMVDSTFNYNVNRYSGIFGRQGIQSDKLGFGPNEPSFQLAIAECDQDDNGFFTDNLSLQFVTSSADGSVTKNQEMGMSQGVFLAPGDWIHMALVNDGKNITVYVNGEIAYEGEDDCEGIADFGYGWSVGAGRKYNDKDGSAVANIPEGAVRRPFCGTISEIRVSEKPLSLEETLFKGSVDYTSATKEVPAENTPPAAETSAPATSNAPEKPTTAAETSDAGFIFCAFAAIMACGGFAIYKRK